MSEELIGLPAYAWGLHKDAYYSAGGRLMRPRNIWVMTVDNFLMVGFETVGREPRYKVYKHSNASAAQQHAVKETQRREKEGFVLHADPRTAVTKGGRRAYLEGLLTSTESHSDLHLSIQHVINKGAALGSAA